jgi:trans-aconitate methyltransferase
MRNFETYFERMSANLNEKLDFIIQALPKIDVYQVIDFGCANGATTEALATLFPEMYFVGVDRTDVVRSNNKNNTFKNITYVDDLSCLIMEDSTVLLLSVLHEIFSFHVDPLQFLNQFKGAKHIFIRDMKFTPTEKDTMKFKCGDERMFEKFLETRKNFGKKEYAEYLLKRRYEDNFNEELKENYFSVDWKEVSSYLYAYLGLHCEEEYEYMNEFLEEDIRKEMRVELSDYTKTTHCKMVFIK